MGSVTLEKDDPVAAPFEAERARNEEIIRARREKRDTPLEDRETRLAREAAAAAAQQE